MTTFSNIFGKTFYVATIEVRYGYFKGYIKSLSNKFEEELAAYEIKLEEQRKKDGAFATILPSFIHEVNKFSVPKYFYNSTFTFVYSMFEDYLKTVCETYQKVNKIKLSVSDLEGRGYIAKCRKYLEKCCDLDMASLNPEWEKIRQYQKVRNAIVHNNSNIVINKEIPLNKQDLYSYLFGNLHIHFDNKLGSFHIKDKEYLLDFCDLSKEYIIKILDLMDDKVK